MSKGEKASFGRKPPVSHPLKTFHLSTYMANKPTIANAWFSVQGLDIANAKISLNLIRVTLGLNVLIA